MMNSKKRICPKCGSAKIKIIIYGLPDPSKIKNDDILGGCCVDEDSPKYHCINCKNEWGNTNFL